METFFLILICVAVGNWIGQSIKHSELLRLQKKYDGLKLSGRYRQNNERVWEI